MKSTEYTRLAESEDGIIASVKQVRGNDPKNRYWMHLAIVLGISNTILTIATLLLVTEVFSQVPNGSYETGFDNDLDSVKSAIKTEIVRFTGGIDILENGTIYREIEGRQYVGRPNADIDRAWEELQIGLNVELDFGEATNGLRDGKTVVDRNGKYTTGLEVHHQLHCLDMLRKHLDFDYYYSKENIPYFYMDHLDHCIDSIRQALQCHSDVTPLRWDFNDKLFMEFPIFDQPHTCRNFKKIDEWARARGIKYFRFNKGQRPLDKTFRHAHHFHPNL